MRIWISTALSNPQKPTGIGNHVSKQVQHLQTVTLASSGPKQQFQEAMGFPSTICYSPFSYKQGGRPPPWQRTQPVVRSRVRARSPLAARRSPLPALPSLSATPLQGQGRSRGRSFSTSHHWFPHPQRWCTPWLEAGIYFPPRQWGWGCSPRHTGRFGLVPLLSLVRRRRVRVGGGARAERGTAALVSEQVALRTVLMLDIHLRSLYCAPVPHDSRDHSSLVHVRCVSPRCFSRLPAPLCWALLFPRREKDQITLSPVPYSPAFEFSGNKMDTSVNLEMTCLSMCAILLWIFLLWIWRFLDSGF